MLKLKPKDAVWMAIQRGANNQEAIREATRACIDEMTDALADLYIEGRLDRGALRRRKYEAA